MPDPRTVQPDGEEFKFFANSGKDSGLLEVDHTLAGEMEQSERILYGEHFVSRESFRFLTALEEELDKEWVEQNLGTGKEKIRLNEKGDIYYFNCSNTKITTLPELPAGLTKLNCSNTPITTLPGLPAGLKTLYCFNTKITTLPELPAGLTHLSCSDTKITTLPELPAGLKTLYCFNTQITTLPELPAGLESLDCFSTQITTLPELPAGLTTLYCFNTPLAKDSVRRASLEAECKAKGIKLNV